MPIVARFPLDVNPAGSWANALMLLAAFALILMLFQYEAKLVPKKVGIPLLILRFTVLLFLFAMLLEPLWIGTSGADDEARILVAVDLSESMTTNDPHAGMAEKLSWARAVGMIGNEKTNARIDRWIQAYRQGKEPPWLDPDEAKNADVLRNRKETVEGVCKKVDELSRKEIAMRLLTKGNSPLLKQLKEIGNVDVVVFAGKTESVDDKAIEQAIGQPPKSLSVERSDLERALAAGAGSERSKLLGVVLLTDGRDNVGRDIVSAAKSLGRRGAPIYPVILGSVLKPTDISIGDLKFPETAFKDDNPILKATINTSGFEGKQIAVIMEQKGGAPVTKTITPVGNETSVVFPLDAKKIGRKEYTLRVDVQQGESRPDNNAKSFSMNIVDDKVRVLLVEGEARWEFRFIDNALERDERVDAKRVVFRQPYLGILDRTFFPRTIELPAKVDDLENSPFAEPDLLILGDIDGAEMPEKAWQLVERFVSEGGGTLVMIAGKEHFPFSHRSPTMEALMPIQDLRALNIDGRSAEAAPTERGFRLHLTPEGEREPMFQLEDDVAANKQAWAELPGHLWGLIGEAKKGATVFAYAHEPGQPQTLERQRKSAVIVHQSYGFGQVLWMGIDSTWRWRHRIGDRYHHRYWGQIGRWAATNKAAAGNEFVKFGPERGEIEFGDDAVIRARWSKKFRKMYPNVKAEVEILKYDDKNNTKLHAKVPFKPDESRPLVDIARAVSLPKGRYKLRLLTPGAKLAKGNALETDLIVRDKVSLELQDLSSNRPLLAEIAKQSNGRVLLPDEVSQLAKLFRPPDAEHEVGSEKRLWDWWPVMLLLFALLTGEWVIRKLNGLP